MQLIPIASLDDPRLDPYRDLRHRNPTRTNPRFIAEGRRVIERLLASTWDIDSVLATPRRLPLIEPHLRDDTVVLLVEESIASQLVGFHFHAGLMACGLRQPRHDATSLAPTADNRHTLVACAHTTLPDNLGAIIRTSKALEVDGVLVGPSSVDPFARRVIRVSMGAVFELPIVQSRRLADDLLTLRDRHGCEIIAATADHAAEDLTQARRRRHTVIVLGNEAAGLDDELLSIAQRRVTIPMASGHDSVNVAIAAAILLYHFQRLAPPADIPTGIAGW